MAVDMFIKIGDIEGESEDKTHKGKIDVLAWSWGMSNGGTTHTGGGGGAGKVNVQDLSFTKYIDASSNALLKACCEGKHYPDATLIVRKAGGTPVEYVVLKLEEVLVTSVSTGGSGGEDRLTENVTLNFAKFMYKFQPQDEKGAKKGGTKDYGFDIAGNAVA
jgi:type VI secretion system secreted protein Hcp